MRRPTARLVAALAAACVGDSSGLPDAGAPSHRIQIKPFALPAGEEANGVLEEESARDLWITRFELHSTAGMHHMHLDVAPTHLPDGFSFPIFGLGVGTIEGAVALPEGYAVHVQDPLVLLYHFFNFTGDAIEARAEVRLYGPDAPGDLTPAAMFSLQTRNLRLAPHAEASAEATCLFDRDVDVLAVIPHTHQYGLGLEAWIAGGPRDGESIYRVQGWEDIQLSFYDAPVHLDAGSGLRFRCRYFNPTDRVIEYGTGAGDEMCLLSGYFAPGDQALWGEVSAEQPECRVIDPDALVP